MFTLLLATFAHAQSGTDSMPFISPMFSDHMVMQRDHQDPVWGWAAPGTKVTVTFAGKSVTAVAGAKGEWMAQVGPVKAGGPYELTVDGPQKVTFTDVLVGDVWICSGQSNMEFGLGNVLNPQAEIGAADHPNLRLYDVPRLVSPVPVASNKLQPELAHWSPCTPTSVGTQGIWNGFSAVGYYFGAKLQADLGIPIGLIHSSWGGTPAEAWTSESGLTRLPAYKGQLDQLAAYRAELAKGGGMTQAQRLEAWYKKNDAGSAGWQDPSLDDSDWKSIPTPGYFQRSGLPEFVNNQSVVWYRHELVLPSDVALSDYTLHFLADDNDVTWVNGVQIGATDDPSAARSYKIPAGTMKVGKNEIVVRVTDTQQPGGIYGDPTTLYLEASTGEKISLAGPWKVKLGAKVTDANPFPTSFNDNPNFPTTLYNGMISPIAPFGVKGAIWYQGESNASPGRAFDYRTLLPAMITSWRDTFKSGSFPFLIVQLAGFGHPPQVPGDDNWAVLRESQLVTTKVLRNVGIASAVDVGEENDIHPKDKKTVGNRLAAVAERQFYGKKVLSTGPTLKSTKIVGSNVELSFDHTEGGLTIKGDVPLFSVAGSDHKWFWAEAKIDGSKVIVSSPNVPSPVAVRYYWASFLAGNLMNGEGWPAFPFRTDTW
jgi:sialate O-acetylesterase